MSILNGSPPPEKRQAGRGILTLRVPAHEDLLRGLPSNLDLAVARQACKVLWEWRNTFDIKRRHAVGLLGSTKRLNHHDGDCLLRRELAALAEGGNQ